METNPELELAYDYVSSTDRHLFLTGKAGTGKTTFLHRIRAEVPKRMAVVAPTGVAAINAKGVTIHSQFQLPFGVITPEKLAHERLRRFSSKKIDLLRSLDLLIIDEISMVRADVLDGIDFVLRRYRRNELPFGGLQLLMIGDLHQLPPVVRDREWDQMREHYPTPYFFGSQALRKAPPRVIQLKQIYRQSDSTFIDLLNRVRNNRMDEEVLTQLNTRYRPDFRPRPEEGYIVLTSHNRTAKATNGKRLDGLSGSPHAFEARIDGDFPESMYPNDSKLQFKVGAQVMFNRNDTAEHLYYNGKLGTITEISDDTITVSCPGEEPILVEPVTWENRRFLVNKSNKEVEEELIGTYEQHPLRLAWAITIHKSQGLTFDRVVIDAADAFAHGQVYVALSRCKTFEGIVLRTPIADRSVKTDSVVNDYSLRSEAEQPTEEDLLKDQIAYEYNCLYQLFDLKAMGYGAAKLERTLLEYERSIQGEALSTIQELQSEIAQKMEAVARKFSQRLKYYAQEPGLPSQRKEIAERLSGAADYFLPLLRDRLQVALKELDYATDNKEVDKRLKQQLQELQLVTFTKVRTFETLAEGFKPERYVRARADASLDFGASEKKYRGKKKTTVLKNLPHPELYANLSEWRSAKSTELEIPPYTIAHNSVLVDISATLPVEKETILRINKFGPKTFEKYGAEIIEIVKNYAEQNELATNQLPLGEGGVTVEANHDRLADSASVSNTKQVSFDAFKSGKSVAEIARERNLKESTIHNHLFYWVSQGELEVGRLIDPDRLEVLVDHLSDQSHSVPLKTTYEHFDGQYTYHEIRLVLTWLDLQAQKASAIPK